ncbi:related to cellulose binding protein CEL1 [Rhynchosporium agropyri]|uniref:lytic cellulose monooxygenase (C4-dehydrogenating) n=1 Tax=Rhynchosporium agropyri TaxID=914238 RepID=A0A1E1K314_9HELO|nr:related to cellulose binding protein CEL1 [Rhynchosporium agropyri]
MQFYGSILLLSYTVNAHYNFPALVYEGKSTDEYHYTRHRGDEWSDSPYLDVKSIDVRCGTAPLLGKATGVLPVVAGSRLGFTVRTHEIIHPGPLQVYMAKVPEVETAETWSGEGKVWFKVYEEPFYMNDKQISWTSEGKTEVYFIIPASTPSGDYLVRVEHVALHSAHLGEYQIYVGCGQVKVSSSSIATPGPLVAFPGAYEESDPGIQVNIWGGITAYTPPGPTLWPSGTACLSQKELLEGNYI